MQNPSHVNEGQRPPQKPPKNIFGVDFTEFELFSIRMISDYLFLDRFNDYASFVRFEQCFGPLFSPKNKQFKLVEAFKEIVGPKRKYLTFKRMVKAYLNWKSKKSSNYSFNFFMSEVFQKMIKKRGEVIGELVEGQRVFSTKNCRNRKVISKFSVLTDETKNIIKGFIIEYDTVFKAILCKQQKPEDIHLEINFELFHSIEKKSLMTELDRDGITHIAGKYNETTKNIKFLIFKCRSGKTLYIGDEKESETDKIVPFIFGSSKCQLKTMVIELINNQLAYIQPKYQLSIRKNDNLDIDFNILDEKYLENDPPKYEESDLESLSPEELKDDKKILFPLVLDDQFVDKMSLVEIKAGKTFKEVYKSFFEKDEKKPLEKLKKSIRVLLDDIIKKERREEKIKNEEKNLALKNTDFESVFVKVIKMKKKMEEAKNSKVTEEDEDVFAEEEEEEDDLNLVKINSVEYQVKEQSAPLRGAKKEEVTKKKEKEPQDNMTKSTVKENRSNHKVVEVVHTSNSGNNEDKKGPQDSKKKK